MKWTRWPTVQAARAHAAIYERLLGRDYPYSVTGYVTRVGASGYQLQVEIAAHVVPFDDIPTGDVMLPESDEVVAKKADPTARARLAPGQIRQLDEEALEDWTPDTGQGT
jgi:hypothetical protein